MKTTNNKISYFGFNFIWKSTYLIKIAQNYVEKTSSPRGFSIQNSPYTIGGGTFNCWGDGRPAHGIPHIPKGWAQTLCGPFYYINLMK